MTVLLQITFGLNAFEMCRFAKNNLVITSLYVWNGSLQHYSHEPFSAYTTSIQQTAVFEMWVVGVLGISNTENSTTITTLF